MDYGEELSHWLKKIKKVKLTFKQKIKNGLIVNVEWWSRPFSLIKCSKSLKSLNKVKNLRIERILTNGLIVNVELWSEPLSLITKWDKFE